MTLITFDPATEARFRACWADQSWTLDAMAAEFSYSKPTLHRIARARGLAARPTRETFWTDERVTTLKRLWNDGVSIDDIANQMGGISRNAIAGKITRDGLNDGASELRLKKNSDWAAKYAPDHVRAVRRTPAKPKAVKAPKPPPEPKPKKVNNPLGSNGRPKPAMKIAGRGAVFVEAESREPRVVVPFREEAPGLATIHTLAARMCKWPLGDPREPGFTFCGCVAPEGRPYCAPHHARAHQPSIPSKRSIEPLQARAKARFA